MTETSTPRPKTSGPGRTLIVFYFIAHLVDPDGELLGACHADVGVRADRDLVARVALAAATALALQGGGEGDRCVGAARAGWAGEQPGVGHLTVDGPLQALDDALGRPAGTGAPPSRRTGRPTRAPHRPR